MNAKDPQTVIHETGPQMHWAPNEDQTLHSAVTGLKGECVNHYITTGCPSITKEQIWFNYICLMACQFS